jgi:acyl-CoA thioesterase FadM
MGPHSSTFRVRFDECAADGAVRAPVLLRYAIETAFAHSAREGFPLAWYDEHGLYWLVRRANLDLQRPVPYGGEVTVATEVVGFRRIWARRRNVIRAGSGDPVGEITMDWIFTDREGQPARIVPEMERAFPGLAAPFRVERLTLGEAPAASAAADYVVPAHQADPRGHMSTAGYLELFEDAVFADRVDTQRRPAVYEIEFLHQSLPGEVLHRRLWLSAGAWMMSVSTPEGVEVARAVRKST